MRTSVSVALWVVLLFQFLALQPAVAEPRAPYPPWPQEKLATFGWDSPFWPIPVPVPVAIGEDSALLAESWSGFALVRDSLTTVGPVVIPVAGNGQAPNVASGHGAIRFWVSPSWSSAGEQGGGKGPGHYARLLEMGNWSGKVAETWWSLYVNETGDTLYFSGQGNGGALDYLKAQVALRAGEWRMLTACYSPTNTALWLDDQVVATGEGMATPPTWVEKNLGLVVGSDVTASSGSSAEAQFEELTTFDDWPGADDQRIYYNALSRQAALGPVGTAEEEEVKQAVLQAAAGETMEKEGGGSYGPLEVYSYDSGTLWLEITGVSNGQIYLLVHGTVAGKPYEILSKEALTNVAWTVEPPLVWGAAGQDWTSATVALGARTNQLFLSVREAANVLSLEITGVSNGQVYLLVRGTVADVAYEIQSKDSLTNVEWAGEPPIVFGAAGQAWTPTTVPVGDRTNTLFFRARAWIDSDGGGMPDWWQLQYFGQLGVDPYGDDDGDGWKNLQEYKNGTPPKQFDIPPPPQNVMATLDSSGSNFIITWEHGGGPVTQYTVDG